MTLQCMLMTISALIISASDIQTLWNVAFISIINTILESLRTSLVALSIHQEIAITALLAHLNSSIYSSITLFTVLLIAILTQLEISTIYFQLSRLILT